MPVRAPQFAPPLSNLASVVNILKVVGPLFAMSRWDEVKTYLTYHPLDLKDLYSLHHHKKYDKLGHTFPLCSITYISDLKYESKSIN